MYIQYTYMIYYVSCMGITVRNLFISKTSQRIGFLHDIWGMAFTWNVAFCWVRNIGFHATLPWGVVFWNLWYHFFGWITTTFTWGQQGVSCKTNRTWNMTWETKNVITAIVYDFWQMMWTSHRSDHKSWQIRKPRLRNVNFRVWIVWKWAQLGAIPIFLDKHETPICELQQCA